MCCGAIIDYNCHDIIWKSYLVFHSWSNQTVNENYIILERVWLLVWPPCRFRGQSGISKYKNIIKWSDNKGGDYILVDNLINTSMCSLFQFHKKRRIVGRIICKNIKSECPEPNCPNPILLPGRCCKVCPGQEDSSKYNIRVNFVNVGPIINTDDLPATLEAQEDHIFNKTIYVTKVFFI